MRNFAVTDLLHRGLSDWTPTAPTLIAQLAQHLGKSPRALARAAELDFINIRRAAHHFSESDAEKLIALLPDNGLQKDFAVLFHRSELIRRAKHLRGVRVSPVVFDQITPDWLLHQVGRGQSQRTGSREDYFTMMLFRMQLANGDEAKVATPSNLRMLYDVYVAQVRVVRGEVAALRNAVILLYAYLGACPLDTPEHRHALLGMAYAVSDLAAQVNDYRWLRALAHTLTPFTGAPYGEGAERALLNRLILDTKSRADRYSPEFERDPAVRRRAGELAEEAVKPAQMALRTAGELAYVWPEVTAAWIGSYFGLLNHGINVGWPPDRLEEMFKTHDDLVITASRFAFGGTLLTEAVTRGPGPDAYAAEFLSTIALARENPARNLRPRSTSYKRAFEPDKALVLVRHALDRVDPASHYGDSIVAALQLDLAEALLCRAGRNLSEGVREEYEAARLEAATRFARLGMQRKLRRLDRLERVAGIVRAEENRIDLDAP